MHVISTTLPSEPEFQSSDLKREVGRAMYFGRNELTNEHNTLYTRGAAVLLHCIRSDVMQTGQIGKRMG
jgi:hypothetical protein